jgi:ketosteroid isomerase-like protein
VQTLQFRRGRKPTSDVRDIADRFEIEALHGEFTDAVMMHDHDRLASLFTPDGAVRMPHIHAEAVSREQIRAGIERLLASLDYFVQTTHPGTIHLDGDTASGCGYISELVRFRHGTAGSGHRNPVPAGQGRTHAYAPRHCPDTHPLTATAGRRQPGHAVSLAVGEPNQTDRTGRLRTHRSHEIVSPGPRIPRSGATPDQSRRSESGGGNRIKNGHE